MMYKWTDSHVLKMPAPRFFALLNAGRKLEAIKRVEDCDIAMIPSCDQNYLKQTRERFMEHARMAESAAEPEKAEAIVKPPAQKVDAASEEAKDFMFQIFAAKKRLGR